MGVPLYESIEKLKNTSARLNKITDDASRAVQLVEGFLNTECSIGLPILVPVLRRELDDCISDAEVTCLKYGRHENKFRILVTIGTCHDDEVVKPWAECDRATKIQSLAKLPDLLELLSKEVESQTIAAENALSQVAAVFKIVKGAK